MNKVKLTLDELKKQLENKSINQLAKELAYADFRIEYTWIQKYEKDVDLTTIFASNYKPKSKYLTVIKDLGIVVTKDNLNLISEILNKIEFIKDNKLLNAKFITENTLVYDSEYDLNFNEIISSISYRYIEYKIEIIDMLERDGINLVDKEKELQDKSDIISDLTEEIKELRKESFKL